MPLFFIALSVNHGNLSGDFLVIVGDGVAIHIQRLLHGGVPKATGDLYDGDAVGKKQGGVGVSQTVEAAIGQAALLQYPLPHLLYGFRSDGMAAAVPKDKHILADIDFAETILYPLQGQGHIHGDGDFPAASFSFRRVEDDRAVGELLHLLGDGDGMAVEIHIPPAEAQELSPAHARINGQEHQIIVSAEEGIFLYGTQDDFQFIGGENALFFTYHPRRLCGIRHVLPGHIQRHRLPEKRKTIRNCTE